jgi:dimethylargininase
MTQKSTHFSHAISRTPSKAIVDGLRAVDVGAPDYATLMEHHADYVAALRSTGAEVTVLPAMEEFPDAVFVEDTALCLQELAIVMRPGAPSRLGEANAMKPTLDAMYSNVAQVEGPGFIEGGDILVSEREILVGLSDRTTQEGVDELAEIVAPFGYSVRVVQTPPGVLHFKTDCSLLDGNTILSTPVLDASGCFDGYTVSHTAEGEGACANSIRYNDLVLMPTGFPETKARVEAAGFNVKNIGNTEAAKVDGGLSCMSLRFSPS